jgi:hypothetical protein
LPENIGPTTTSIHPMLPLTISTRLTSVPRTSKHPIRGPKLTQRSCELQVQRITPNQLEAFASFAR